MDLRDGEDAALFVLAFDPHTLSEPSEVTVTFRGENVDVQPSQEGWSRIHGLVENGIIVIPEHRSLTHPPRLDVVSAPAGVIREDLVHPDALLPTILAWWCAEEKGKIDELHATANRLLGNQASVRVRPNPAAPCLMVQIDDEPYRDISNLGAGIVEILTLAMALTKYDGGLLLYEEPELHLHPEVQRRVMNELIERAAGAWQVLMTTHSNHFVQADGNEKVAYFAIERVINSKAAGDVDSNVPNRSNEARLVKTDGSRKLLRRAVELLGALPSGLLMANKVIWVEGPSDAIYLKFFFDEFLRRRNEACLIEHHDYAFAFFGGALLYHTEFTSDIGNTLVNLLTVHPGSYLVADSDRAARGGELGKKYTKALVARTDCAERIWFTAGREIENYLRDEVLCWAITGDHDQQMFKTYVQDLATNGELLQHYRDFGVFSAQVGGLKTALGREHAAHATGDEAKVPFAWDAVDMMRNVTEINWLDRLDLEQRVAATIEFIRQT